MTLTRRQESPMVPGPDDAPASAKNAALDPQKKIERNFLTFLEEVDEGRLAANCTDELAVLVREIHSLSKIEGLKPKGRITIELTISSNKTVMDVVGEVKTRLPRRPRSGSAFFRTRDNQLSAVNPAQLGMEFRDVNDPPAIVRKV